MKTLLARIMTRLGMGLCALAVAVVPAAASACRFIWYQPEEPDNLSGLIKK